MEFRHQLLWPALYALFGIVLFIAIR